MNPEDSLIYVPIDDVLDYMLENNETPEHVFKWALDNTTISTDSLYEFFAGFRTEEQPRLNPKIPVNYQLGPYTKGFVAWAQTQGTEYGKLINLGADQ